MTTQKDWEKRFWEYYEGRKEKDGYINPSFLLLFIAKELADARREVITHLKYVFEEIEPYADRKRMLEYMDNYVKNCLGKDEKTTNKQTS